MNNNSFIRSLIHRHTDINGNIKPRTRGHFEPEISSKILPEYPHYESGKDTNEEAITSTKHFSTLRGSLRVEPDVNSKGEKYNAEDPPAEGIQQKTGSKFRPSLDAASRAKNDPKKEQPLSSDPETNLPGENPQIRNIHFHQLEKINSTIPKSDFEEDYKRENAPGKKDDSPLDKNEVFTKEDLLTDNTPLRSKKFTPGTDDSEPIRNKKNVFESSREQPGLGDLRNAYQDLQNEISTADTRQVINVTIGRIEVRAVSQPTPPVISKKVTAAPKMSLEEYLKKRNNSD